MQHTLAKMGAWLSHPLTIFYSVLIVTDEILARGPINHVQRGP